MSSISLAQSESIKKIEDIDKSMYIECFGTNKEENARLISCATEMFDLLLEGYFSLKINRIKIKDIMIKVTGNIDGNF